MFFITLESFLSMLNKKFLTISITELHHFAQVSELASTCVEMSSNNFGEDLFKNRCKGSAGPLNFISFSHIATHFVTSFSVVFNCLSGSHLTFTTETGL